MKSLLLLFVIDVVVDDDDGKVDSHTDATVGIFKLEDDGEIYYLVMLNLM